MTHRQLVKLACVCLIVSGVLKILANVPVPGFQYGIVLIFLGIISYPKAS